MAILNTLLDGNAKGLNALRKAFIPEGTFIELLRISDTTNSFVSILTIYENWYLKYDEDSHKFRLQIADDSDELKAAIDIATHVSVSDEVYTIQFADTVPLQGEKPFYSLYAVRFLNSGQFGRIR